MCPASHDEGPFPRAECKLALEGVLKEALTDAMGPILREHEEQKRTRRGFTMLIVGNMGSMLGALAAVVVGVYRVGVHLSDREIHTRIRVEGTRPVWIDQKDRDGKVTGQMWVWPEHSAAGAAWMNGQ